MADLELIRTRCGRIYGVTPVDPAFLQQLERALGLALPPSFRAASTFFDGSGLAVLPLHAMAAEFPLNILNETLRLRTAVRLPPHFVVLGEPPESLLVMNCDNGQILWCDATDVARLNESAFARAPEVWSTYGDFLSHILDLEEEDQA